MCYYCEVLMVNENFDLNGLFSVIGVCYMWVLVGLG